MNENSKANKVLEVIREMNKIEDCSDRFFYQDIVEGKIVLVLHEESYQEFESTLSKENQKTMRAMISEINRTQFGI